MHLHLNMPHNIRDDKYASSDEVRNAARENMFCSGHCISCSFFRFNRRKTQTNNIQNKLCSLMLIAMYNICNII